MIKRSILVTVIFSLIFSGFMNMGYAAEIVRVSLWNPTPGLWGRPIPTETPIALAIAKRTGVLFDIHWTPGDPETALNLRLASGNWEETIYYTNRDWVAKLVKAKVIIPLDKYFKDPQNYPNLAKIPPKVLENFTFTDGHIYAFPSGWFEDEDQIYGYWCVNGWYVHPKYLKAVGMTTRDLSDIKGVEKFLLAVKTANLKTEDGLPVLSFSSGQDVSTWRTVASTFGVSTAGMGFEKIGNDFVHYRDNPKLKDALLWLNRLYRSGCIDREITAQKNEQLREKLMRRRVAMLADAAWNWWPAITSGVTPATEMEFIHYPRVTGVKSLGVSNIYNPWGSSGLLITTSCKNPDAVAKHADWALTTGVYRAWELFYGPRGEFWDWDPREGAPYHIFLNKDLEDALKRGDYNKMAELGVGVPGFLMAQGPDLNYYRPAEERKTLQYIFDLHRFYVKEGFTAKARPWDLVIMPLEGKWNRYNTILSQLDTEYFAKLITAKTAKEFEDVWKTYRTQLEAQGHWSEVKAEWLNTYKSQFNQ